MLHRTAPRSASVKRRTSETDIVADLRLDGAGGGSLATGIGFFDHMLHQLVRHSLIDLSLRAEGDLYIDAHHTVEDTGIALGEALREALGDKTGVTRFGEAMVPMDETLARVVLDLSGRSCLVWNVAFTTARLGEMDTELFREFFQALARSAGLTLHCEVLYGENNHHKIEAVFKAFARALRQAVTIDPRAAERIPSSKGVL